jgi:hypothetical protein
MANCGLVKQRFNLKELESFYHPQPPPEQEGEFLNSGHQNIPPSCFRRGLGVVKRFEFL